MNYLVPLDACAGELEKILSGMKRMLVKEFDPAPFAAQPVRPGDNLYFLRNMDECTLRVKATVVRVLPAMNGLAEDLSHTLKEMQPRLQLTEDQYNYWSAKKQVLFVEFDCAQKINPVKVAMHKLSEGSGWVPFEQLSRITG